MGQRPKPPTEKQMAAARKKYLEDVEAGRRIPLPDLGQVRDADGAWRPVAGEGPEVITPHREPVERPKAKGVLSEVLLASDDWSLSALHPYAQERTERMRRLRCCNAVATTLRGDFSSEGRERRRRARERMQAEPELGLWRRAYLAGPESVPASAFDASVYERLCALGAGC
jgi:hypothetical protein